VSERDDLRVRDLFEVYRAIDTLVAADRSGTSLEIARRYIPEYSDERTVGWTSALEPLFRGAQSLPDDAVAPPRDDPGDVLRSLAPALERIAETNPRGRQKIRLVIGLAVLGRLPTFQANIDGDLLRRAFGSLRPDSEPGFELEEVQELAELVDVALDDGIFPDLDSFQEFATRSTSLNLLSADVAGQGPRCTDSVTMIDIRGELQPVTRLWTQVDTTLTDEQITRFIDPMNWPACNSFYCDPGMIDGQMAADGVHHLYTEVLSTDCEHNPQMVVVGLWFTTTRDEHGFTIEYDLAPPPDSGNGFVEFDKGEICGEHKGGGMWTVTSTKFLRFSGVLDGAPLALTACILGYGNYALDFVAALAEEALDEGGDEIPDWDPNYDPERDRSDEPDSPDPDLEPGWDQTPPDPS
jgi:hypothetical protein